MKKFLHLLNKENSVRGASIILMATLALSNVLGLFRDRFLTKNISMSELDIYYSSFRIPDLLFNFLILGAITSAFIPVLSDYVAKKETDEGLKVTNSMINIASLMMIVIAVIFYFIMPYAMPVVVPKFSQEKLDLAIKYSRLLMLTPIFFSISYILGGVLNTHKRFFAYSLAPLFYNLSIIVGAAYFAPKYGLIAVIYAVIIGSFCHLLVQLPSAIRVGYRYQTVMDYKNAGVKKIVRLMVPRTIGLGTNQLMIVVFTAFASSLTAGSIAAFELSNNIQTMPIVVFGTSFATAVFPTLTRKISENDCEGFSFYLNRAIRTIAFLLIPSSLIFILMRAQIIRLILGSGKFNWDDTKKTALTLAFFSISLLAQGLIPLLARAFYSLKNTRTPMYISIISSTVSVLLAYPCARLLGVAGLALAFTIGSYFNALLLLIYLRKNYNDIWNKGVAKSFAQIITISLIMGLFVWGSMHLMSLYVDMSRFWGVIVQTSVSLIIGAIAYIGLSTIFHSQELKWAVTRKINGSKT